MTHARLLAVLSSASVLGTSTSAPAEEASAAVVVEPAPGQAAASPPSPSRTPITATCSLGEHLGIDDAEARTAADILCHELAKARATNTEHEVRFGTLGGRTLVTVASRSGNAYDERRTFLARLDEIDVAAPRLVKSLSEGKSLDETRDVDNVLASEARSRKSVQGKMGFDGELFGTTALGAHAAMSAGIDLGLLYRGGSFGLGARGRAGGIGSGDEKVATLSLDIGGRYYLSSAETSPFVGGGVGILRTTVDRAGPAALEGSGFAGHAQIGIELLRTHRAAFTASVRVDLPFFSVEDGRTSRYVAPLSLNTGIVFQ